MKQYVRGSYYAARWLKNSASILFSVNVIPSCACAFQTSTLNTCSTILRNTLVKLIFVTKTEKRLPVLDGLFHAVPMNENY